MKNPRIVGALVVGVAVVGFAFYVRAGTETTPHDATVIVADTPRTYIRTNDTDGDGMRDWEEGLYGTDPQHVDERPVISAGDTSASSSDTEIPDTMTARFSIDFFSKYFQVGGDGEMDTATREALLTDAQEFATRQNADRPFSERDVSVRGGDDLESVRAYGNALADALTKHTIENAEHEILILERALLADDPSALAPLADIRTSYEKTLTDTLALSVPPPFAALHLDVLNSLLALHNNITAMEGVFTDALPAMVRFQRHTADMEEAQTVLRTTAARLTAYGVTYSADEPGNFWNLLP